MKKLAAIILSFMCIVGLAGCGSQSNDHEQLAKENAELKERIAGLEVTTSGKVVRINGGFEAYVRHKIPNYLREDDVPEAAVVTRFQDGPIILNLGSDLAGQVEEGSWYYFTIEDKEIELDVDPEYPELFVWDIFDQGMNLRIRSVTPCEPTGLDGDHLNFSMD